METTGAEPQPTIERLAGFVNEVAPNFFNNRYLYRGVTNSGHSLVPSLARHLGARPRSKEVVSGLRMLELEALNEFWMRSQVYGGPARPFDIAFMALAAHYRLRTSLLDWTFNPLVALYFAVSDSSSNRLCNDGAVYILAPDELRWAHPLEALPISYTSIMGLIPNHIDARMAAQETVLTIHPPPWQALASGDVGKLTKLIVPKGSKATLRRELRACGIHEQTLFPGLEGLASLVNFAFLPPANAFG